MASSTDFDFDVPAELRWYVKAYERALASGDAEQIQDVETLMREHEEAMALDLDRIMQAEAKVMDLVEEDPPIPWERGYWWREGASLLLAG